MSKNCCQTCYETKDGRYAEFHIYQVPCVDDDGLPDGWAEQIELYTFPTTNSTYFTTRQFTSFVGAQLFLKMNGYTEIVE